MDIDLLWKVSRFYNWLFVAFIVALPVFLLCAVAMATSGHDKLVALFGILCIMCIPAGLITASRYEHLRDNVLLAPDVRRLSEEYVQCRRRMAEIEALVYDTATGKRERELVYVNRITYDGDIRPSASELDGGRFWTRQEIADNIGKQVFTPNFEDEYLRFFGK